MQEGEGSKALIDNTIALLSEGKKLFGEEGWMISTITVHMFPPITSVPFRNSAKAFSIAAKFSSNSLRHSTLSDISLKYIQLPFDNSQTIVFTMNRDGWLNDVFIALMDSQKFQCCFEYYIVVKQYLNCAHGKSNQVAL